MHMMEQVLIAGLTVAAGLVTASPPPARQAAGAADPIPYFIADGRGKTGYRATDPELARWALRDWERASGKALRFEAAPEAAALVRVYWAEPAEGEYGEMRPIAVGDRTGAAVYIRPDVTAFGPDIADSARRDPLFRESIVYLTCVHELVTRWGCAIPATIATSCISSATAATSRTTSGAIAPGCDRGQTFRPYPGSRLTT